MYTEFQILIVSRKEFLFIDIKHASIFYGFMCPIILNAPINTLLSRIFNAKNSVPPPPPDIT
jgi:hypothetical protein